jgi:hypothetical protein
VFAGAGPDVRFQNTHRHGFPSESMRDRVLETDLAAATYPVGPVTLNPCSLPYRMTDSCQASCPSARVREPV